MRLINVNTYELREFVGNLSTFPNYAILSHTWGDEEVSFQDFQTSLPSARQMKGFKKIKYCCEQAAKDGLDWAWVDTCCIDKASSSELSEAINSMYNWYRTAIVCYAYLNDVLTMGEFDWELRGESIRWFQRGWTLQELIAPLGVKFFAEDWTFIGTKRDNSKPISDITGIDREVLRHERSPFQIPVAERMYWASKRRTTRAEDLAYCLMGLFDVNIPLLYGEGMKAFDRLQEQILKTTNDDTLFLWQMRSPEGFAWGDMGDGLTLKSSRMLACSPKDFDRRAGHFLLQPQNFFCEPQLMPRELGLRITLPMRKMDPLDISRIGLPVSFEHVLGRVFLAALGCLRRDREFHHSQVVILLEAATSLVSPEKEVLRRVQQLHCFFPLLETMDWPKHTCFVAGDAPNSFEKNEKLFLNHVDLKADSTFTMQNVKGSRYLGCQGFMTTAFIMKCGITGQIFILFYAMNTVASVSIQRRAYIQLKALPANYDALQDRYSIQFPQSYDWDLCVREGYGPVLEYEIRREGKFVLMLVLKCEELRTWTGESIDEYKLYIRCTRI